MSETLKTQKDRIVALYESEVLNDSMPRYLGAHGTTTRVNAEKILVEGLITAHISDLGRTCLAIPSSPEEAAEVLLNYEHRQPLKFILIVSHKPGIKSHQIIEEYVPELVLGHEHYNQYVHRIPSQFIKGYFDVEAGLFVKNAAYNPNAEPVTLRRSAFPSTTLEDLSRSMKADLHNVVPTITDEADWVD